MQGRMAAAPRVRLVPMGKGLLVSVCAHLKWMEAGDVSVRCASPLVGSGISGRKEVKKIGLVALWLPGAQHALALLCRLCGLIAL